MQEMIQQVSSAGRVVMFLQFLLAYSIYIRHITSTRQPRRLARHLVVGIANDDDDDDEPLVKRTRTENNVATLVRSTFSCFYELTGEVLHTFYS
jgi:hypothetical protein